jgi:hypothetical protein
LQLRGLVEILEEFAPLVRLEPRPIDFSGMHAPQLSIAYLRLRGTVALPLRRQMLCLSGVQQVSHGHCDYRVSRQVAVRG